MLTRRDFHRNALLAAGTAALGTLAGCSQVHEVPNSKTGGASGAAKSTLTIGMIAKSQSNPVFLATRKGAETRAAAMSKELGMEIKIDWRTPNDEDAQKQADFVEQLAASNVDAITIACSDASKVTRSIDAAVDKGITVMCFDSDAPESKRLCYVGTDDSDAGRMVMSNLAELIGGKDGTVAILAGNQTATNLQKRVNGAKEELAKHPNLKLKDVYYHKETPQDAYAQVESVQKANPDITAWAMIGGWPLMTERALPWKEGEVLCVSVDTLPPQLKHIEMGDVQILLGQQCFAFGERCVEILVDKLKHQKDPATKVEYLPLDKVTKENVQEYAKNWEVWG